MVAQIEGKSRHPSRTLTAGVTTANEPTNASVFPTGGSCSRRGDKVTGRYDVIVIGAGLGGLSVATFLAVKGKKVLLLERRNVPGGYASSFVKGRFEFEASLHALSGVGLHGARARVYNYLDSLGMADDVEFISVPDVYRSIFPDLDVTLPANHEGFEQVLREKFPAERDGITTFMKRLDTLRSEVQIVQNGRQPPNPATIKNLLRFLPATWSQVLDRDVNDPVVRGILSQMWGYLGPGPAHCSFVLFGVGLNAYLNDGLHYIKGRSQHLSQAFVNRIRSAGGDVVLSTGVERITTKNGRITGVVTEHGETIEADNVVSNAPPSVTVNELLPPGSVPSRFHDSLRFRTPSPSSFNVYLGLDGDYRDLGLHDYETFINDDTNLDEHASRMNVVGTPGLVVVTNYNAAWNDISPPGTSITVLTSLMFGEPWTRIPPEEYEDRKQQVADAMMTKVERAMGIDLRGATEVVSVSTPLSNVRYAGTTGGALYGSMPHPHDATVFRVSHKGPLEGLYFVGAWTQPGGAYDPAMTGGLRAGQALLEDSVKRGAVTVRGGLRG